MKWHKQSNQQSGSGVNIGTELSALVIEKGHLHFPVLYISQAPIGTPIEYAHNILHITDQVPPYGVTSH